MPKQLKSYTVITRHLNGMVYPMVVRAVDSVKEAEKQIWRLGDGFEVIATIEGKHHVHAPSYGIAYEVFNGDQS